MDQKAEQQHTSLPHDLNEEITHKSILRFADTAKIGRILQKHTSFNAADLRKETSSIDHEENSSLYQGPIAFQVTDIEQPIPELETVDSNASTYREKSPKIYLRRPSFSKASMTLNSADDEEKSPEQPTLINSAPFSSVLMSPSSSESADNLDKLSTASIFSKTHLSLSSLSLFDEENETIHNVSPEEKTTSSSVHSINELNVEAAPLYNWYLYAITSDELKISSLVLLTAGLVAISIAILAAGLVGGAAANALLIAGAVVAPIGAIGFAASSYCSFFSTRSTASSIPNIDEPIPDVLDDLPIIQV